LISFSIISSSTTKDHIFDWFTVIMGALNTEIRDELVKQESRYATSQTSASQADECRDLSRVPTQSKRISFLILLSVGMGG